MILRASALGLFVFTSSLLAAQVPAAKAIPAIQSSDDGEVILMDGQDAAMPMEAQAPPQAGPAKKSSPRAEKLKKLEYDRRPSTILKAWANPPKQKKEEEKPAEAKPAEAAPTPAEPAKPLTPEEAKKKEEAEAAQKKAAEEAKQKAAEAKLIDEEMSALQRNVTLGDWAAVKEYFG